MTNIPKAFIFLGRSGCGKGTQADLLIESLKSKTIKVGTGDLLRKFVKGDSYTQKLFRHSMENGGLMPESLMVSLWNGHLTENFTGTEDLVFDGCPRKLLEAKLLDAALKFYGVESLTVIYINVSREWSKDRLTSRSRNDDTPEAIDKRLSWFDTDVMPTIEYYKGNPDYKFFEINGERPIDEVQKEIQTKLGLNL